MFKNKIIKIIFVSTIFINTLTFSIKLSEIEGLNRVSDYNQIKDIEVEKIVPTERLNRRNGLLYENGQDKPFTGVLVGRKNGKIHGFYIYKNGKNNGIGNEYFSSGKIETYGFFKNDELVEGKDYDKNGNLLRHFKQTNGIYGNITHYYTSGKISAKREIYLDNESEKNKTLYMGHGKTVVYEKNGNLMGELNFENGSMRNLRQKLYKNGKLKLDYVSDSEKIRDKAKFKDIYMEYYNNSDQLKYMCNQIEGDEWNCEEYTKKGDLKRSFKTGQIEEVHTKSWHGSFWINFLLGILGGSF